MIALNTRFFYSHILPSGDARHFVRRDGDRRFFVHHGYTGRFKFSGTLGCGLVTAASHKTDKTYKLNEKKYLFHGHNKNLCFLCYLLFISIPTHFRNNPSGTGVPHVRIKILPQ